MLCTPKKKEKPNTESYIQILSPVVAEPESATPRHRRARSLQSIQIRKNAPSISPNLTPKHLHHPPLKRQSSITAEAVTFGGGAIFSGIENKSPV